MTDAEMVSDLARLVVPELKSHYEMDVITVGDEVTTPDSENGYDMTLTTAVEGTEIPVQDANTPDASDYSLLFNNSDSDDPNAWNQYGLIDGEALDYQDITIAGWYYCRSSDTWQRAFDFGYSDEDGIGQHYLFLTPNNGSAMTFVISVDSYNDEKVVSTDTMETDQWVHVVGTLEGDTGRLYVNGELVSENTEVDLDPTDLDKTDCYIARSQYSSDPYFNGMIDDFRIYSYALDAQQVATLYTESTPEDDYICLEDEENPLTYDLNNDCRVNLYDVLEMADVWLECQRVGEGACGWAD